MKEAKVQQGRFSLARLIIGVVSIFVSVGLVQSIIGHWEKRTIITDRQEAFRLEQARNQELTRKLEEATGSAFIEKEAREKLGLVKPGDTIVLLDASREAVLVDSVDMSLPTWKKWWKLFF